MSTPRPSEFALIAGLLAPLTRGAAGAYGLSDDAATLAPAPGCELVLTKDALVEGVHFLASDPPDLIARKALRVNLSDLAAKGAVPVGYLLALMLPAAKDMAWIEGLVSGFRGDGEAFALPLLGGDTTATPGPFALSITALGQVPVGQMLRRAGAMPGDRVFVSGTIGGAGGGLACLQQGGTGRSALIERYRLPVPRLALGQGLRGLASACLDVSDGLIADLGHIAEVSGVRIVVAADQVPLLADLRALWGAEAVARAATAGDDYELAFTVPLARVAEVMAMAAACATPVCDIGRVEAGAGCVLQDESGTEVALARSGWIHF